MRLYYLTLTMAIAGFLAACNQEMKIDYCLKQELFQQCAAKYFQTTTYPDAETWKKIDKCDADATASAKAPRNRPAYVCKGV